MPEFFSQTLLIFILVGFAAQLVDGALGMAFGVISTPAASEYSRHSVEGHRP